MRWGRKMGPPYPLDASDHSAAEKKEGYRKSLGGGRNESLYDRKAAKKEARKEKYSNKANIHDRAANAAYRDADDLEKNGFKKEADAVRKVGDKQKEKADRKRELQIEGKMTGKQKAVVAGAGTLAAISLLQSKNNIALANEILGEYGKVALKEVIGKSAVAAGKAAVLGGLGTYGAIKVGDLISEHKNPKAGSIQEGSVYEANRMSNDRLHKSGAKIEVPKKLNKEWFDKHTGTMVVDKKTGDHISVDKETLRKKGINEAIKQARDPEFIRKNRKEEAKLFDKTFDYYLKATNGNKEEAYKQAMINWSENTGLTKKSTEEFIKKYSSISIP